MHKDRDDNSGGVVAMSESVLARFLLDFFNVLARFFFYYQKVSDLDQFLQNTQEIFSTKPIRERTTDEVGNTVTLASTDLYPRNLLFLKDTLMCTVINNLHQAMEATRLLPIILLTVLYAR